MNSASQWVQILSLFSPTSFYIHTKRISQVFVLDGKEPIIISVQSHVYIDDVLSISSTEFENYLCQMFYVELEIKDITSAPYLYLELSIRGNCQLHTSIYDKRDDFNLHTTNFPFLSSNIPCRQPMAFLSLSVYDTPGLGPRMNDLRPDEFPVSYSNGPLVTRLQSSFKKFYCRYGDLIQQFEVSISRMFNDILTLDQL